MCLSLIDAARQGEYEKVLQLLNSNADINALARFENGWLSTPLHEAARKGHRAIVELLLQHGADIYQQNLLDERPAFVARASFGPDDCLTPILDRIEMDNHPSILIQKAIQQDWRGFHRAVTWAAEGLQKAPELRSQRRPFLEVHLIPDIANIVLDYSCDESYQAKALISQKNERGESGLLYALKRLHETSHYFFHGERITLDSYPEAEKIVKLMLEVGVDTNQPINNGETTTFKAFAVQKNLPENVTKMINESVSKEKHSQQR